MDHDWITSPSAAPVLSRWNDDRPSWLWTGDGQTLVWRNHAALMFGARLKKSGLKRADPPEPLKGQVPRLIRLGSLNRASLSRMQFTVCGKPISATCTVMPVTLPGGGTGLLVTGVDAIDEDLLAEATESRGADGLFDLPWGLIDAEGRVLGGADEAVAALGDARPTRLAPGPTTIGGVAFRVFEAGPDGAMLLIVTGAAQLTAAEPAPVAADVAPAFVEPPVAESAPTAPTPQTAALVPPEPPPAPRSLAALVDKLSQVQRKLDDERQDAASAEPEATPEPPPSADEIGVIIEEVQAAELDAAEAALTDDTAHDHWDEVAPVTEPEPPASVLYRVTGRGFIPPPPPDAREPKPADPAAPVDPQSRYNFDQLSKILNDRVSGAPTDLVREEESRALADAAGPVVESPVAASPVLDPDDETPPPPPPAPPPTRTPPSLTLVPPTPPHRQAEGSLIALGGETFVLNRLPIGILVFRDQSVLFANRALTELTGHRSADHLREHGIAAIFPSEEAALEAGPVSYLMTAAGNPVPVNARLQSITWQGKPSLMLSASAREPAGNHEAAVATFAEALAMARGEAMLELNRAGVVEAVSGLAASITGREEGQLVGQPVSLLVAPASLPDLRAFLELKARFAETARPVLLIDGATPAYDLTLFAKGQAGVVSGYVGLVRRTDGAPASADANPAEIVNDAALMGRLSRGIRRPLNTVIGFSALMRSNAFGPMESPRHAEYVRDIHTAGQEILALVDELDDYARIKDGRYAVRPADFDLGLLLETCMLRIRGQAGKARVLIRSAISERLPRIRADRASLSQAILNLLASAIDQTPAGSAVVMSAQQADNGTLSVHVRDAAASPADLAERFVVFRDGTGKDGSTLMPVRSSVGLALTRSLLAVNACSLSIEAAGETGTIFTLVLPAELVVLEEGTA